MTDKRSQENELDAIQINLYILKCLVSPLTSGTPHEI
jgi:hypothetical protein